MKRTLIVLIIIAAFTQVKAQQLFQLKPTDSLKNNFQPYFKVKPDTQLQLVQPMPNNLQLLAAASAPVKISTVDHMPIAVLQGYSSMPVLKITSDDKMPVLKLGGDQTKMVAGKTPTP